MLVNNLEMHARVVENAKLINRTIPLGHGRLKFSSAIEALFRCLHVLHKFWSQKTFLTFFERELYLQGSSMLSMPKIQSLL